MPPDDQLSGKVASATEAKEELDHFPGQRQHGDEDRQDQGGADQAEAA